MPTTILDGETYEQARHRRFTEEAKVIEKIQQDEIIRMAREAGFEGLIEKAWGIEQLERFAALVAAHEREACAKVCDVEIVGDEYATALINSYADTIRARSNDAS